VFEYLILMLVFTVPFISYALYKRRFKTLAYAAVIGLAIGVPWDMIATHLYRVWSWNEQTLIGVWVGGLPLEEWLFMVLTPMALIGALAMFKIEVTRRD